MRTRFIQRFLATAIMAAMVGVTAFSHVEVADARIATYVKVTSKTSNRTTSKVTVAQNDTYSSLLKTYGGRTGNYNQLPSNIQDIIKEILERLKKGRGGGGGSNSSSSSTSSRSSSSSSTSRSSTSSSSSSSSKPSSSSSSSTSRSSTSSSSPSSSSSSSTSSSTSSSSSSTSRSSTSSSSSSSSPSSSSSSSTSSSTSSSSSSTSSSSSSTSSSSSSSSTSSSSSSSSTSSAQNLIPNGQLENEAGDGTPTSWHTGNWGANSASFTYPSEGVEGKGAMVNMTAYTDGDGKWYFDDVAVTPGTTYNFSDYYKSTGPSLVVVRYTDGAGAFTYVQIGAPAITSQWQQFSGNFTPPAGTVSVTVFHLLNGIGTLWVDKFSLTPGAGTTPDPAAFDKGYVSLTFDDGWNSQYLNARSKLNTAGLKATFYIISQEMFNAEQTNNTDPNEYVNVAQVQQLQADGHEISAHTRTHASLISLSPQQLISEVQGSRTDLQSVGIQPSDTFAYPYGDYSTSVIQAVKNAGYVGARSVEGGFNTKTSDKFVLKTLSAEIGTPLQEIKNAIDAAAANKVWLTLMFHNVDNTGSQYSTTPESLQQIIDYIKQKNIAVITVHEGVQKMQ